MIPLIALFICFLAIAGVGVAYAYNSSTIQINDNPVNEQYYTLDYTNDTGGMIATVLQIPVDTKDMTITTSVSVVDDGDPATNDRTFNATINKVDNPATNTAQFTRTFYVKLASNMDADQKFAVDGTVDGDDVINAIFGECTFKFYKGTGFTEEVTNTNQFTASQSGIVYKVVLTVPIKANVDVKTLDLANGGDAIVDAVHLTTALGDLDNHKFSVTMSAIPVES